MSEGGELRLDLVFLLLLWDSCSLAKLRLGVRVRITQGRKKGTRDFGFPMDGWMER